LLDQSRSSCVTDLLTARLPCTLDLRVRSVIVGQKHQVELLFPQGIDCLLGRSNNHFIKPDLFQKHLKLLLNANIVVNHQSTRLVLLIDHRQHDNEVAALAQLTLHADCAALQFDDFTTQR
jgi:hypothetical protein